MSDNYSKIKHDQLVKNKKYIPYLTGVSQELIDKFNNILIKNDVDYYQILSNPYNYSSKTNQYITKKDIYNIFLNKYSEFIDLYSDLTTQLKNKIISFNDNDYVNKHKYEQYLYQVENQLYFEIVRLNESLAIIKNTKEDYNFFTYNNLYLILFITTILFIIFIYNIAF